MQREERGYIYEKAEQLAAEAEELLDEARWFAGVETKDALNVEKIAECLEKAYTKIENIEGLIDKVMLTLNQLNQPNKKGIDFLKNLSLFIGNIS